MNRKVAKVSEARGLYKVRAQTRTQPRNPMRNMRTAARLIVRAHEHAFRELEKF